MSVNTIVKSLEEVNKAIEKEIASRQKGGVSLDKTTVQGIVKLQLAQNDILAAITLLNEVA